MTTRHYLAVAERTPGEEMWSILFPDFPGVTSVAADIADVPQQARDALATAVEDMIAEGESLPVSVEADTGRFREARVIILVPVEMPEVPTTPIPASTEPL